VPVDRRDVDVIAAAGRVSASGPRRRGIHHVVKSNGKDACASSAVAVSRQICRFSL